MEEPIERDLHLPVGRDLLRAVDVGADDVQRRSDDGGLIVLRPLVARGAERAGRDQESE